MYWIFVKLFFYFRYTAKVKELSLIYHDRPVSPDKELVHWVEHVIKTKGAPHLRSPALYVPWYQKMYLDLVALILAGLLAIKIVLKQLFSSKRRISSKRKIIKRNIHMIVWEIKTILRLIFDIHFLNMYSIIQLALKRIIFIKDFCYNNCIIYFLVTTLSST